MIELQHALLFDFKVLNDKRISTRLFDIAQMLNVFLDSGYYGRKSC